MPYRILAILACAVLYGFALGANPAPVEIPNRSKEKLAELSTHIVTAGIVALYERQVEARSWATTHRVAEMRVKRVEKGELHDADGLIYVRYWDRKWVGKRPGPPSTHGHRGLPSEGDSVRLYLAHNAYDGFGTTNEDGGFNVLGPNGFAPIVE